MTATVSLGGVQSRQRSWELPHVIPTLFVTTLVVLGGSFFWPVFESAGFLVPPLIGAILIAVVLTQVADHFELTTGEASVAHVVVASLSLPGLLRLSEAKYSLPVPSALAQLVRALIDGPVSLLTSPLPARSGQELLVAPVVSAWVGLLIGWLFARRGHLGRSLLGPIFTMIVALAFGPIRGPLFLGVSGAFLASALLYVHLVGWMRDRKAMVDSPNRPKVRILSFALMGMIVSVALLLGSWVPGLASDNRFTLRQYRQPPFDPAELPSPLAEFQRYKKLDAGRPLFTATGALPDRWRLASLTSYDGRVWSVGRPDDLDGGEFRLVGARLSSIESGRSANPRETEITLDGLNEPWLPMPGQGLRVAFSSISPQVDLLRSTSRYNDDSHTLVAPKVGTSGAVYNVTWAQYATPDEAAKQLAAPGSPGSPLLDSRSRERLAEVATYMTGASGDSETAVSQPWSKVIAIRDRLQGGYFAESTPPGHTYGDLVSMVANPEAMIGNEEHYAALLGVLSRTVGVPVRVVVGFRPQQAAVDNRQSIFVSDLDAWVEVDLGAMGWQPVDITISDTEKKPKPQEAKPKQVADVTPTQPNIIPPVEPEAPRLEPSQRKLDPPQESSVSGVPILVVGAASAVLGPTILVTAFIAVVALLKARRRRRRRNRSSHASAVSGAWEELLDRCREAGVRLTIDSTFEDIGRALPFMDDLQVDRVKRLIDLSDRAAFHPSDPQRDLRDEVWGHVDEISSWFREHRSAWKRLKLTANPRPLFGGNSLASASVK